MFDDMANIISLLGCVVPKWWFNCYNGGSIVDDMEIDDDKYDKPNLLIEALNMIMNQNTFHWGHDRVSGGISTRPCKA